MKKPAKKKLPVGLNEEFVAEVESASVEVLKEKIVNFQKGIDESRAFLKGVPNGDDLKALQAAERILDLKAAYDEAAAPTRETIRALNNRTKFVLDALKKAGG